MVDNAKVNRHCFGRYLEVPEGLTPSLRFCVQLQHGHVSDIGVPPEAGVAYVLPCHAGLTAVQQ